MMEETGLTQAARNWMNWVAMHGSEPIREINKDIHDLSRIGERGMVIEEDRLDEHADVDLHDLMTYFRLKGYKTRVIKENDVAKLVIRWV